MLHIPLRKQWSKRNFRQSSSRISAQSYALHQIRAFYLRLKTLDQDGHQQVEEDVVPEGHEGDEVEGSDRRGGFHAVVQNLVPVLLG